jgi:hypothetical protein
MTLLGTAPHKPLKGEYRLQQRQTARDRKRAEEKVMDEARRRDHGKCRWPSCKFKDLRVEVAHLEHRGSGGNPSLDRTQRHKLIALCLRHHQLIDLKVNGLEPIDGARGTDGPMAFYETHPETGVLTHVYTEPINFISETRGQ